MTVDELRAHPGYQQLLADMRSVSGWMLCNGVLRCPLPTARGHIVCCPLTAKDALGSHAWHVAAANRYKIPPRGAHIIIVAADLNSHSADFHLAVRYDLLEAARPARPT